MSDVIEKRDAMDVAAGLTAGDPVWKARRFRPEFVDGAEACRVSVLEPHEDQGLSRTLRLALALRMARLNEDETLVAGYAADLKGLSPDDTMMELAGGGNDLPEPLATIAQHADMVTMTPRIASEDHIHRLEAAGLTNPQIVALSELIAFVNFQTRVATGLRLLRKST